MAAQPGPPHSFAHAPGRMQTTKSELALHPGELGRKFLEYLQAGKFLLMNRRYTVVGPGLYHLHL